MKFHLPTDPSQLNFKIFIEYITLLFVALNFLLVSLLHSVHNLLNSCGKTHRQLYQRRLFHISIFIYDFQFIQLQAI